MIRDPSRESCGLEGYEQERLAAESPLDRRRATAIRLATLRGVGLENLPPFALPPVDEDLESGDLAIGARQIEPEVWRVPRHDDEASQPRTVRPSRRSAGPDQPVRGPCIGESWRKSWKLHPSTSRCRPGRGPSSAASIQSPPAHTATRAPVVAGSGPGYTPPLSPEPDRKQAPFQRDACALSRTLPFLRGQRPHELARPSFVSPLSRRCGRNQTGTGPSPTPKVSGGPTPSHNRKGRQAPIPCPLPLFPWSWSNRRKPKRNPTCLPRTPEECVGTRSANPWKGLGGRHRKGAPRPAGHAVSRSDTCPFDPEEGPFAAGSLAAPLLGNPLTKETKEKDNEASRVLLFRALTGPVP